MKNKILFSIFSRSRPKKACRLIKKLIKSSNDINNFDVQLIIDNDQVDDYRCHIEKYNFPNLFISNVPHIGGYNWTNLIRSQYSFFKYGQYYFLIAAPDDIVGISGKWDKRVLEHCNCFPDDLFVLYSNYEGKSRRKEIHHSCYTTDPRNRKTKPPRRQLETVVKYHEILPFMSYKFANFMYRLFYPPYKYNGTENSFFIAKLIQLLYTNYRVNRNVNADYTYKDVGCERTFRIHRLKYIFPHWDKLQKRKHDDLHEVAKEMYRYIKKFNRRF